MPTWKITDRRAGIDRRVGGNLIADTDLSALAQVVIDRGDVALVSDDYLVEKVSDQPEPRVYTVVRQDHEDPGKVWEVMTTGSRDEGIGEVGRGQARGQVRSLVEETVGVNRVTAKGRRS